MSKTVRSWSKPENLPGLIGRKKVDKSIFRYGSHIPIEFIEDFEKANGGIHIERGERRDVTLLMGDKPYKASLYNMDRKGVSIDSLQLRYDGNKELREILTQRFPGSYKLYVEETKDSIEEGEDILKATGELNEYIDFYETGEPFVYKVEIISSNPESLPSVWWVNQGKSIKAELAGGFLWAPTKSSTGVSMYHWETITEVQEGDIVLNYANGALRYVSRVISPARKAPKPAEMGSQDWENEGRLVKLEYHELKPSIELNKFADEILKLDIDQGPITKSAGVKQGYLFRFNLKGLRIIQDIQPETHWPDFTKVDIGHSEESYVAEEKEYIQTLSPEEVIKHLHSYVGAKGFTYQKEDLINFYLSLKAKPFVILAGVSGTGKTKLVRFFAEAIGATKENGRYKLISVRPDWNDSSDLLGYNDIEGNFKPGPLTTVIKEASNNLDFPYIVCLDEMNLSRVEYYFSDFLSLMETRDEKGYSDIIFKPEQFMSDKDREAFSHLKLPPNLYIIGTVNMDETTFPFSKKVLDRANTIEFVTVNLGDLGMINGEKISSINIGNHLFQPDYIYLKDCLPEHEGLVMRAIERLQEVNAILEEANQHIGYRVRDEICFYMVYNHEYGLLAENTAFDYQLMQKILPRLQGSNNALLKVLVKLFKMATGKELKDEFNPGEEAIKFLNEADNVGPYPITAKKIANMTWRFEDGFTSFWA